MTEDFKSRMENSYPALPKILPSEEQRRKAEMEAVSSFRQRYSELQRQSENNPLLQKERIKLPDLRIKRGVFFKIMIVISVLVVVAGIAGFLYLVYMGKFQSIVNSMHWCGNVSLACSPITVQPTSCSCPVDSNNFTCSPQISLNCGNST